LDEDQELFSHADQIADCNEGCLHEKSVFLRAKSMIAGAATFYSVVEIALDVSVFSCGLKIKN
jgi:hypothetical protein